MLRNVTTYKVYHMYHTRLHKILVLYICVHLYALSMNMAIYDTYIHSVTCDKV